MQTSQIWSRQKNVENGILLFQLAEQILQDSEREHISPMILNL